MSFIKYLKKNWLYILPQILLVIVIYANSIDNGPVSDDKGLKDTLNLFRSPDVIQSLLSFVIKATIFALFGDNPTPYHVLNIIFHLINTLLVFLTITKLTNRKAGLLTSLLFASHPVVSETVNWISASAYLQFTTFFLVSFYFYIQNTKSKMYYFISIISFLLMILTFNRSVHLFLIFPLYELALGNMRQNYKRLIPYFIIFSISIFVSLLFLKQQQTIVSQLFGDANQVNPIYSIPAALTQYLVLIFWPFGYSFLHTSINISAQLLVFRFLVLSLISGLGLFFYYKNRNYFFFVGLWFLGLLLYIIPLGIASYIAERYAYFSSIGILALVSTLIIKISQKSNYKIFIYSFLLVIILLLGLRTYLRNRDWQSETSIYEAVLKVYPNEPRSMNIVASGYYSQGKKEEARLLLEKAIKINPLLPDPYVNLGNYYADREEFSKAVALYEKALEKDETLWGPYYNLASIYYLKGDNDTAFEFVKAAINFNPQGDSNYVLLGNILLKSNRKFEAEMAFRNALRLNPNNKPAQTGLQQSQN